MNRLVKDYARHAKRVAWLMPALGRSLKSFHRQAGRVCDPAVFRQMARDLGRIECALILTL